LYNPLPRWQQQASFLEPVPIPAAHPGDAPLVCVQINQDWIPYVLGGVWQLAQPTSWVDTGGSSVSDVLNDVQDLMGTIGNSGACGTPCGVFNGIDSRLAIGPASQFNFSGGGGFSVLAWVWTAGVGTILSQDRNTSGGAGWGLETFLSGSTRNLFGFVNNGTTAVNVTSGSIFFGLVAMTYDVSHIRLFYQGTLLTTVAASINPAYNASQPAYIGRQGTSAYFSGLMSDIQLYSGRVSDADVAAVAVAKGTTASSGTLVGRWKLDEGTGTTAADSSGHGNTATWNATGPLWSTWPT
jgi:hypothetical protein